MLVVLDTAGDNEYVLEWLYHSYRKTATRHWPFQKKQKKKKSISSNFSLFSERIEKNIYFGFISILEHFLYPMVPLFVQYDW